jgi:TonB family protein
MRMRYLLILTLCSIFSTAALSLAQDSAQPKRKIISQTMPHYPEIARRMHLTGTVRVAAIVTPDGKVKNVETLGGSPILAQAAQASLSQWKFAPAAAESREVIEIHFNPDEQ